MHPPSSRPSPWRSRGYLPHFDAHGIVQHVTFRLADSLPAHALLSLEAELRSAPAGWRKRERRVRLEEWIDAGLGSCLLRADGHARLVEDALLHFDGTRYRLAAWVVMPNHVHALLETLVPWELTRIVWSWKSFTGRRLGSVTSMRPVWHREYWDRFVRDEEHFAAVKAYVERNPVQAGLVRREGDWRWSSAWEGRGERRAPGRSPARAELELGGPS